MDTGRDGDEFETPQVGDDDEDNFYNDISNYSVEKKIGRGQFSVVYKARCLVNNKLVAFKKVQVKGSRKQLLCLYCYGRCW
eukprot:m.27444 g.27444  ORF g.27444 m.27444 type:complete len:81 (-) comp9351_c0_seq5:70-312(-)